MYVLYSGENVDTFGRRLTHIIIDDVVRSAVLLNYAIGHDYAHMTHPVCTLFQYIQFKLIFILSNKYKHLNFKPHP